MPRTGSELIAFNRGLISRLAIARVDLKRMAFSAETMTNWMPRTLGSMMLRPGLQYLGSTHSNAAPRFIPFVFATDDTALIEFTGGTMRVWIDDVLLSRVSVSTAISNGRFDSSISFWTDNDESGASSVWVAGGYMGLTGTGTNAAIRDQTVTVASADQNKEHGLRIIIERGPVTIRIGSTSGGDEYISERILRAGAHSLAFTPTGDFYIRFLNRLERQVLVDSCQVEASGTVALPSPYLAANVPYIRGGTDSQSADVIFIACKDFQQRRVERQTSRSWSLVRSQSDDGPFRSENVGPTTITASGLTGNITLTASAELFNSEHAPSDDNDGALFRITSNGQTVTQTATAENSFTDAIKVTGVDNSRVFGLTITGLSGTGSTVTLQRSVESDTGTWSDVTSYTTDQSTSYDDGLDNQITWYRIGVKTGGYSSGTIVLTLTYSAGSIDGVVRITGYSSATSVSAEVLSDLGGTSATDIWAEGQWSDYRGWPTSVAFYEGRLGWSGKNGIQLSVSDAFESHDEATEGDSGPINRTIGSGPVDTINWILPLQRLLLGAQGAEFSCRSTAFDEPLTPSNFNIKEASGQGSSAVQAMKVDTRGAFIQRGGTRVFELAFNSELYDYSSTDLTQLIPEIGQPQILRMAVQRQPDTRIHCVRSDGGSAVLVWDKVENVLCWLEIETDGDIEDVVILPGEEGDEEDRVYYVVNRTINGSPVRYLEKWATEAECVGGTTNKQADAFVIFTNATPSASIPAGTASHLIGESVVVWADGKCLRDANDAIATFTVASDGGIPGLTNGGSSYTATQGIVGIAYTAQYKTAKLGRSIGLNSRIDHMALLLADTHMRGLEFGQTFDDLEPLPLKKDEADIDEDTVHASFDQPFLPVDSKWSTDSRVCLQAKAPRCCTVLGVIATGEFH